MTTGDNTVDSDSNPVMVTSHRPHHTA
ncbi:MAG: hypothetical protein QOG79_3527, partial [Mycobacterium sp.]|nr:hypothetical protein [Mycobacterium sp.]